MLVSALGLAPRPRCTSPCELRLRSGLPILASVSSRILWSTSNILSGRKRREEKRLWQCDNSCSAQGRIMNRSIDRSIAKCNARFVRKFARFHTFPLVQPELGGLMNCSHWSIKSDQFLKPYLDLPTFLILFAMFVTSFAGSVSASERDQQMHKK